MGLYLQDHALSCPLVYPTRFLRQRLSRVRTRNLSLAITADMGFTFEPLTWIYFSEGLKHMVGACIHRRCLPLTGCLIPALFALAGCGGSGLATVEGKVTVDGQPV